MTVERFDIDEHPDHGRPLVARFKGEGGALHVHVKRDDGSLWVFGYGPAGGDRGTWVCHLRRAGQLAEWLDGDISGGEWGIRGLSGGQGYVLSVADGEGAREGMRKLRLRKLGSLSARAVLSVFVKPEEADEFVTCLREWATAAALA